MASTTRCAVCGGATGESLPGLGKCLSCGLVFRIEKIFAAPVYEPGLEEDIYRGAKQGLFSSALAFLGARFPRQGKLLDIGCAAGDFLKAAALRGWEAEGIEIDTNMAAKASSGGSKVYASPVEALGLPGQYYEAITAFEVFSQMDNPAAAAAEISRLLKPGGILYARDYNACFHLPLHRLELKGFFRGLGVRPSVVHNFNFGPRSLHLLLQRAGFRDITIRNSRPTPGDPYRTGGRLGGFLTSLFKVLYYYLAQALWLITLGRVYAGSALIATAKK
ncbi:MAG TPA: hypothetical protein DEQ38_03815 [Elusimicrobia bacterium]|nr:MAG: hypothetical protein A2089_13115 [Elusimicrobia bacterium GWD2_63_28]HCC47231.1 hypothetical protein [Elusimicrobiota bacterium]